MKNELYQLNFEEAKGIDDVYYLFLKNYTIEVSLDFVYVNRSNSEDQLLLFPYDIEKIEQLIQLLK